MVCFEDDEVIVFVVVIVDYVKLVFGYCYGFFVYVKEVVDIDQNGFDLIICVDYQIVDFIDIILICIDFIYWSGGIDIGFGDIQMFVDEGFGGYVFGYVGIFKVCSGCGGVGYWCCCFSVCIICCSWGGFCVGGYCCRCFGGCGGWCGFGCGFGK